VKKKKKKTLPGKKKTEANQTKSVPVTETRTDGGRLGSQLISPLPNKPGLDQFQMETSAQNLIFRSITSLGSPLKIRQQDGVTYVEGDESACLRTFGTSDTDLISGLFIQVVAASSAWSIDDRNYILSALQGIGPRDAIEGHLAAQMVAVHKGAMVFMARAAAEGQPSEAVDANLNRANKFLRTFIAQMEGLNRHRGKITQSMVVGDVNVADGGQAIVGPVSHPGPGKVPKDDEEKKGGRSGRRRTTELAKK
jgi:hypothetical protein